MRSPLVSGVTPEALLTFTEVGSKCDAQLCEEPGPRSLAEGCTPAASGLLCLSDDPGRGLRAGRGLREGMMAGRAMLTIWRPGTCAWGTVLLWEVGFAAKTCNPSVALRVRPCWFNSWVEARPVLVSPMRLSVSRPTGCIVWGCSPATCPRGKHGTTLLIGSWTTSG